MNHDCSQLHSVFTDDDKDQACGQNGSHKVWQFTDAVVSTAPGFATQSPMACSCNGLTTYFTTLSPITRTSFPRWNWKSVYLMSEDDLVEDTETFVFVLLPGPG